MSDTPFPDTPRVDAHDKVRGAALFAADDARPDMLHAALAVAKIGRGRIVSLDTRAASAVPGVRLILGHEDLADMKPPGLIFGGRYGFQSFQPMLSPSIAYRGQPIALIAADTLEAAIEASGRVEAAYAAEPFNVTFDVPPSDIIAQADSPLPKPIFADRVPGDADQAFSQA